MYVVRKHGTEQEALTTEDIITVIKMAFKYCPGAFAVSPALRGAQVPGDGARAALQAWHLHALLQLILRGHEPHGPREHPARPA